MIGNSAEATLADAREESAIDIAENLAFCCVILLFRDPEQARCCTATGKVRLPIPVD
jgi:hypothetical protein